MEIKLSEIKKYLIDEQGYTEDEVENKSIDELVDLYGMYTED